MAFDFKKDLAKRVAKNPQYDSWVKSIGSKDADVNDAYFYAFKDAYEKNGFKPTEDNIRDELSDRYWSLANGFKDGRGYSDGYWDRGGYDEFTEKYGSEDDFISKGLRAHGSGSSDVTDDEISQALDDYTWEIGPKDTIGAYADSIARKLNVPRERVSGIILKDAPRGSSEESNMQEAIDYWYDEVDRKERLGKIIDKYLAFQDEIGNKSDSRANAADLQSAINNSRNPKEFRGLQNADEFYDEILDIIRSRKGGK